MDHQRARVVQDLTLAFREVDAVGEDGSFAHEAEARIDVGVVLRPRKQPLHQLDLRGALREMRVEHAAGMVRQQLAGKPKLLFARRDGETHRKRIAQAVHLVPLGDEVGALLGARFGALGHGIGRVGVHHGRTRHQTEAAPLRRPKETVGRLPMHRGEDQGARGAVAHQLVEKALGGRHGMALVGVSRLFGEGEAIEPFEQVVRGRRQHAVLREVNVRIDQSRQDDLALIALARSLGVLRRQVRESAVPQDAALPAHDHRTVFVAAQRPVGTDDAGIVPKTQRAAAQDPRCGIGARRHPATRSSMRKRMMRQTLSIAFPSSTSRPLATRSSKAARIIALVAPLTAKMKGISKRSL